MSPRPRVLIFDAGNTLIRIAYDAIAEALLARGYRRAAADVEEAEIRARVRLDPHLAPGRSTESRDIHGRYLRYVLEHLGVDDEADIAALARWRDEYNRPVGLWHRPEPAAREVLRRVRAAGVGAGVISNSNGTIRSVLEAAGLAEQLDFVIDSGVVGVEKPDPRIFALALAEARVPAEDAVYVGDLYSIDVLGARRAGMRAILLDPHGLWGPRDCPLAPSLDAAVTLALGA